ncbi:type II toxin-antitoxin system VapC family toxin [Turneriella parva]|uniref:Ribonuclease VapC n=1 Tax=Turneriella parva (strain ATCC BAA-1111 / DSM 21527 / NCTC 11395 / H) TaxID=869212 RepID=I4B675_TURPD|nr:type II toxin-antitoxin system VapC family toxin [Turneriella parva]AFM12782.1 PilT protein domain protein [Turneriella parva DSM 21527]
MQLLLDTNTYTELARGNAAALSKIQRATHVYLSFVSLGELRAGFAAGSKAQQNEKVLQKFLASERVRVLFADSETTHYYAKIYAQLRKAGTPIPVNDLWIAALAMQHGVPLYTLDAHFRKVDAIDLLD